MPVARVTVTRLRSPCSSVRGALAAQVGGMGEIAPWLVGEPFPLSQEVVAVVVPDFRDGGMHHRQLG